MIDGGWLSARLDALAVDATHPAWLPRLLLASDFAFDTLRQVPGVLASLEDRVRDPRPPMARWQPGEGGMQRELRWFRRAEGVRLIARDLLDLDRVAETLAGSSRLADACIALALDDAVQRVSARHGAIRDDCGYVLPPVVFALGKLGGGELNFSSDVDLVFAYSGGGHDSDSDGDAALAPDAWHARVVRHFAQRLGETDVDGFSHRVDLRLRPFGQSGKPSLSFPAMEQYFQREGRDWERYAWLKARAVAGDVAAGEQFLASLRPFIYRRYLDYNAIDALREMKAQIDLEVQRQDLADDIKLGRGGIREVEFLVQVVQLVRGGREAGLRQRGLLDGLAACMQAGYVGEAAGVALRDAYLFLRRLENRLQMLRDAQTQALPLDATDQWRIATTLGYEDWSGLRAELDRHRDRVAEEFSHVLAPRTRARAADSMLTLWRALAQGSADAVQVEAAGIEVGQALMERLRALAGSPGVQALSARARTRLDRLMAALLDRLRGRQAQDDEAALAIIDLLQILLRRSNYLALLEQQPAALDRLFELARGSRWLVQRLVDQPLLLDDVFDPRAPAPPDCAEIAQLLATVAGADDPEAVLTALGEVRTSLRFRLGLATIDNRLPAPAIAERLAAIAQEVLHRVLDLALVDVVRRHGWPAGAGPGRSGLALIGYGSLGARELGFASDLDLVFVFDGALGEAETDGPSPVEGQRFYARVVQKLLAYLAVPLPGGRLYEVDARLRPDGAKGLLVTSLDAYAAYQRERAWTWEQQALVRARFIAGDAMLGAAFTATRAQWLAQPREPEPLRQAVADMRGRLRRELDRSRGDRFDLKQGRGGLVDLEFLLQYLVLAHSATHAALLDSGASGDLIAILADAGVLAGEEGAALSAAHASLLAAALRQTLDARPRTVVPDAGIEAARRAITRACAHAFGEGAP
ncbi:bifunctional [glutamate--ammonia ligase]-adenylyl-L-tyrosine phosphorylase/[glutamate--ammonia-ligase] adenylyltransferase [Pseudofulvimonas gallinarii]|uniref:Bifunctional glutamine synthetase adenylyltransferase/adenylyl-removing enzyme n=1 Tax=Pseudofulvimonas gallinarii TaxID=634155 RepID=A0A4R3L4Z1_9GAMM|nr:bifunctional [glutamate--ammonia ligase]-adenylyl-L-tyrosine phosphorylase/[glutamate--ammonia-ligase] adenylyltransferase [Pseudofulvimonas gallinarii]TCS94432.1 glutamate-ammonia-ligase adenylyltransferase [Pseudofulvimonas gallinarii]THD12501.1 bifunctional glutamine synthetase adenylyltransferase/deadenyltransferase [Pseudofulvimonas gallinarii]